MACTRCRRVVHSSAVGQATARSIKWDAVLGAQSRCATGPLQQMPRSGATAARHRTATVGLPSVAGSESSLRCREGHITTNSCGAVSCRGLGLPIGLLKSAAVTSQTVLGA
jgi:hypothetical protein